ncbi:MAG: hypothetical protein IJ165_04295 [Proteobacteria bacterium]|nr:hypothetical protein [Pseudomonadota bacterium]
MSSPQEENITASEAMTAQNTHVISNSEKQENYKTQFERLEKAIDNAYYLEAIMIEYAIIEDRTASILAYEVNNRRRYDNMMIQEKLNRIKNCANQNTADRPWIGKYFSDENSNNLIDRIIDWKNNMRNTPTHKLMKIITTKEELCNYANTGADLCRELSNRATNYRRMVERHSAQPQPQDDAQNNESSTSSPNT